MGPREAIEAEARREQRESLQELFRAVRERREPETEAALKRRRILNEQYKLHANGATVCRRLPKRDKSMSARQWRRQVKAERQEAKTAA